MEETTVDFLTRRVAFFGRALDRVAENMPKHTTRESKARAMRFGAMIADRLEECERALERAKNRELIAAVYAG